MNERKLELASPMEELRDFAFEGDRDDSYCMLYLLL